MVLSKKKCVIKNCKSSSFCKNFTFPESLSEGIRWLCNVENEELQNILYMDIVKEGYFVCYKHFAKDVFLMSKEEVHQSHVPCINLLKEDKKRRITVETVDEPIKDEKLPKKRRRLLSSYKSESDGPPCELSSTENSPVTANSPKKTTTRQELFTSPIRTDSGSPIKIVDICNEITKGTGTKHDFNDILIILNHEGPIKLLTKDELTPFNMKMSRIRVPYKDETPKRCYNYRHSSEAFQNYDTHKYEPKEKKHHEHFLNVKRRLF